MKSKRVPLRTCTGCGKQFPKKDLIRVLKTPEEEIILDITGKKNGRGAYICQSLSCLQNARKRKSLNRSLNVVIPDEVYQELERELKEFGTE